MPVAMLSPVVSRIEVQLAVITFERFLQRVLPTVNLQQLTTSVGFIAAFVRTLVRFLPGMDSEVFRHGRSSFIRLIATFMPTFVGFFVSVASPVDFQIIFRVTALITKVTREWRDFCMQVPIMHHHFSSGFETRSAVLADEFLPTVILSPVTLERCLQTEFSRTIVTLVLVLQLI